MRHDWHRELCIKASRCRSITFEGYNPNKMQSRLLCFIRSKLLLAGFVYWLLLETCSKVLTARTNSIHFEIFLYIYFLHSWDVSCLGSHTGSSTSHLLNAPRISDSVYCVDSETSAGGWAPGLLGYSGLRTQLQVWRWLCLAEHCDAIICNWELFPLNNLFVRALVWDLLTFSKMTRTILSVKYDNTCTKLLSCLLPLRRPGTVLKHYFRSPLSKERRW